MSTSTPAENLIQAMRNIVREMTAAGKFAEGIQRATVFIDSMAGQEKSNVWSTFGPSLAIFYAMRARLYTELDEANGDVSHADTARADVQKAEAAFDMYFEGFSAEQKAIVRANIASAISPEKKIRRDAIDEIESSLKAFPPSKSQPDGNAMMDDRLTPRAKANTTGGAMSRLKMILTAVWVRTPAALIGAVLWGIPVLLFSQKSESGPGPMGYFATFIAIALFIFALKGWDWNSQYKMGTYGNFFKFLALMGIMITGVGFIFAFFWTGKSVLRLFAKK